MDENQSQNLDVVEHDVVPPTVVESLTKGEILSQVDIARRYPRSIRAFRQKAITLATFDEGIAMSCFYRLARSGKAIEGPSVRLAEICAASYGNMRAGARVVEEGEKFIVAQGIAHDLESNVAYSVEVRRRITTKDGRRYGDDMIGVTANAACAIALRNAVFKAVPAALIKPILDAAKKVAVGTAQTLTQRRGAMVEKFAKLGVTEEQIAAKVNKASIEEIDLKDIEALIGTFNGLKDGDSTVEEEFPAVETNGNGKAPSNGRFTKDKPAKAKDEPKAEPEPDAKGKQEDPGEREPGEEG